MLDDGHRGHAHARQRYGKTHTHDVNTIGIFIHILGDAVNSFAVSEFPISVGRDYVDLESYRCG